MNEKKSLFDRLFGPFDSVKLALLVSATMAAIATAIFGSYRGIISPDSGITLVFLGAGTFLLTSAVVNATARVARYLDGQKPTDTPIRSNVSTDTLIGAMDDRMREIERLILEKTIGQNTDWWLEAKDSVRKAVTSEITRDLEERVLASTDTSLARKSVMSEINASLSRLSRSSSDLSRRGTVNLLTGIGLAVLGFGVLGYSLLTFDSSTLRTIDSWAPWVTLRIAFVVVIEVLAYFFLRMYKNAQEDIKYFQNEITNLEMRAIGITLALIPNATDRQIEIALLLATTERNFVMAKDQTTIDLERRKIDASNQAELARSVGDIIRAARSEKTQS